MNVGTMSSSGSRLSNREGLLGNQESYVSLILEDTVFVIGLLIMHSQVG